MAKDNRQKKRIKAAKKAARAAKRGNGAPGQAQVPLRGGYAAPNAVNTAPRRGKKRKKKKNGAPVGKIILTVLSLLFLAALVWLIIEGVHMAKSFLGGSGEAENSTVINNQDDGSVGYYLIGLMGEKNEETGKTGPTQMFSLVRFDKEAKTVSVMQLPTLTYLGDTEHFAVDTLGEVWNNPKPLDWCESCKRQVTEEEIKDNKHNVTLDNGKTCNTKITQKTGSSEQNLMNVFNYLYSIKINNYYLMPQEAFVKLVDLLGGVDLKLGDAMTLGEITYESGVHTVDGEGALEYALGDWESVNGELNNMVHQRQVFVALFERLMKASEKDSFCEDTLLPLMKGSTPIRIYRGNNSNDIDTDSQLMADLLKELNGVKRSDISICLLPGEVSQDFYSVHKDELVTVLTETFHEDIKEKDLKMTELANTEKSDLKATTFDKLLVKQSGFLEEKEEEE